MTKRMKKQINNEAVKAAEGMNEPAEPVKDTAKAPEGTGEEIISTGIRKEIDVIDINEEEIEEARKGRNGRRRVISVLLVFLCTILLAVAAGISLALWDLGKTPTAVIDAIQKEDAEPAMAKAVETAESVSGNMESEPAEEAQAVQQEPVQAEPLVRTDETANIEAIVRAGDEDVIADGSMSGNAVSDNSVSENEVTDPNEGYPRAFTTVDLSYFDDALFIGDSRMEGFGMHSGTNATFYATKGFQLHKYETMKAAQTEAGKAPIFDVIPQDAFTKIYIKVGLNEMGWGTDEMFLEKYAELIARLRESEPRAIIYVHALLPVTAEKSAEDSVHSNGNIAARNELLNQFAQEQKAYYIGINSVVSTEDGSLKPEMTTDGIHLKAQYMDLWREYLRTHAVELLQ